MYSRIQLTKNHLAKSGTERFREYVRTKMEEIKMAKDKKMVEAITSMEEDFAQWYTDVVKKADLIELHQCKRMYGRSNRRVMTIDGKCTS